MKSCSYNCYIYPEKALLALQELEFLCCPELLLVQEEEVLVLELDNKELANHEV